MPRKRQNEVVQCQYYRWVLRKRGQTYFADGRSNATDLGRYSVGNSLIVLLPGRLSSNWTFTWRSNRDWRTVRS